MSYFSNQLKKLRTESGMTMQELADAANVSKSMICKIEKDDVHPTLDVAGRLSKALGKTLSEMLHATQTVQAIYLPKEEQAIWEDAQHIKRRNISPVFAGLKIEWLQVELPVKTSILKNVHLIEPGGEKFILVIKGELKISIHQKTYHLKKGDSLYFESASEHELFNSGKETVSFFIVIKHP